MFSNQSKLSRIAIRSGLFEPAQPELSRPGRSGFIGYISGAGRKLTGVLIHSLHSRRHPHLQAHFC